MNTAPPTLVADIQLKIPAEAEIGGETKRVASLSMRRPKTRHVKQLIVLIGPEFVKNIMADGSTALTLEGTINKQDMIGEALALLVDASRLDGLTGLIADLCREDPAIIDDIDPIDFMPIGKALFDFFPELQSTGSSNS